MTFFFGGRGDLQKYLYLFTIRISLECHNTMYSVYFNFSLYTSNTYVVNVFIGIEFSVIKVPNINTTF